MEADLSDFGLSIDGSASEPSPSNSFPRWPVKIYTFITVENLRWLALRLVFASLLVLWLMATSIGAYFLLYRLYMPIMHYEAPVYFSFDGSSPPSASIVFDKDFKLRPGIAYDYILDVGIPDIPGLSENIGNFMAILELSDGDGPDDSIKFARPVLLPYRSSLVRYGLTLVKLVPLLLGWTQERLDMRIILADAVVSSKHIKSPQLRIKLGSPRLPLYAARLFVTAHLTGLRYWLYHWRITAAFFLILGLFLCQLASAFLVLCIWTLSGHFSAQENEFNGFENGARIVPDKREHLEDLEHALDENGCVPDTDHRKTD
jgi:hypothetical protein